MMIGMTGEIKTDQICKELIAIPTMFGFSRQIFPVWTFVAKQAVMGDKVL